MKEKMEKWWGGVSKYKLLELIYKWWGGVKIPVYIIRIDLQLVTKLWFDIIIVIVCGGINFEKIMIRYHNFEKIMFENDSIS